ncbi:cytochrome P450 [Streptomyces pinistramenti]|uniref:cytochrome P450 n=1 Tax=Streptomyces pinistramenti TaxID=2884812 RepID=UPI001D06211B|nr:cytochrome P450 [Streptomyces pinistramenti]MCB5905929.1 cytochrome P450 [Streptomyces pinistramenti]
MSEAVSFPQDRTCPYHPPTAYQPLREQGPLAKVTLYDGRAVWAVTGHAEARTLLVDPRLSSDRQNPAFPIPMERLAGIRRVKSPLIGVDDPEHNTQRRMLIPSFSVKRIAAMRPEIQRIVDELIDRMLAQGPPAELVSAFALPVPSMVICALLGVPYADHEFFEEESRRLLRGPSAQDTDDARLRLEEYFSELVARKEKDRGEGLLDDLVAERLHNGDLEREELVRMAMILLIAGHETTANMISLGTFALLEHPEQLAQLRSNDSLMPTAVEELLRFLSIADGMLRVATDDVEIAGRTIRAGDGVMLATSLINRDGSAYADPDALDWDRSARHHVGFGFGIHQCLGQNLARTEMEIAFRSLFRRIPGLRLAAPAEEIPFKPGGTLQGMVELPLAW